MQGPLRQRSPSSFELRVFIGCDPATVLRAAFAQAMRWEWIWDNPAERAHRIVAPTRELHPPTPDELGRLLDYVAERDAFHVLLVLGAYTGARRAQLLGLRWHNVHPETCRVSFSAGWVEGPHGPRFCAPGEHGHMIDTVKQHDRTQHRGLRGSATPSQVGTTGNVSSPLKPS